MVAPVEKETSEDEFDVCLEWIILRIRFEWPAGGLQLRSLEQGAGDFRFNPWVRMTTGGYRGEHLSIY